MPYRSDPRPVFDARMAIHLVLTAIMAWLGFVLILPAQTFSTALAWRLFDRIAGEGVWAVTFLMVALVGAVGVDTPHRWLKTSSLLVLATAHGSLALLFLFGNPYGGAGGTYAIIALLGYYLVARIVVGDGAG